MYKIFQSNFISKDKNIMGIYRSDYIFYGWKLSTKSENIKKIDIWSDDLLPLMEGRPDEEFSLIIDQMSNEYMVFGILLDYSFGDEGWNFKPLNLKTPEPEKLKSKFRELFKLEPESEPTLFIFSHFS